MDVLSWVCCHGCVATVCGGAESREMAALEAETRLASIASMQDGGGASAEHVRGKRQPPRPLFVSVLFLTLWNARTVCITAWNLEGYRD